jgi:type IV pilus assembly protein PilY1
MCTRLSRLLTTAFTGLVILLSSLPVARADDTEIYMGQPTVAADGRPNILFILDTSGSMNGNVQTQTTYDPNVSYGTSPCSADRIYWKSSTSSSTGVPVRSSCNFRNTDTNTTAGYVDASKFLCKTAKDVIDQKGFVTVTRSAQWRPRNPVSNSKWEALNRGRTDQPVDCADDSNPAKMDPPHGDGTKPYAANGANGPYSDESAQQINWSGADTSGTYTYYSSNYLNWYYTAQTVTKTRLEIIQESLLNTIASLTEANIGLMRFDTTGEGGMILQEISDIGTARSEIEAAIKGLFPSGNTPLGETYYEAALYWRGMKWDYGSRSTPTVSVRESRTSADDTIYKKPISSSCQKNFIVYLTDGEPVADSVSAARYRTLPGFKEYLDAKSGGVCTPNEGSNNTNGVCLDDLAGYMFSTDVDDAQEGRQNVITYSVGFGSDVQNVNWAVDLLKNTAARGGGSFYEAGDTATLTEVFTNILQEILAVNTTFTAPTVSVNAFNRTQNLNDLYIAVFGTAEGNAYHWPGNVKKYELEADGTIVGADQKPVVDPSTGFFLSSARSHWSTVVDGADVNLGGAASNIPVPADRKLYTDIAGGTLTAAGNAVSASNAAITAEMLGLDPVSTDPTRDDLIEWVRGADIDNPVVAERTLPRHDMGDPLHGRPATVIYGGTAQNPDMMLYAVTNDGYLHAIDAATGIESWAYVPSHLLRRMNDLHENKPQPAKRYSLDGSIRVHRIDTNNDGIVNGGEKVYLFFGMGRGGSSYFALDVTDKNAPELLWRKGAPGEIDVSGNLIPGAQQIAGLAQTWSTPVVTQVNVGGTRKQVLIVGGGYDPSQDNVDYNTDDIGNRIYILDALTGSVLWSAGPTGSGANLQLSSMVNSFPADVRALDMDNDGLADRMYAGDTGGRVWRFDIINGNTAATLVNGGVFASLGTGLGVTPADAAGATPTDARRFYYAPDLAMLKSNGQTYVNVAIGSGYRGHPLDTSIHERFYSLRDYQFAAKTQTEYDNFVPITNDGLVDVTTDLSPTIPADSPGWRMDLRLPSWQGEKVLAEARTFQGTILFTSYLPKSGASVPGSNSCIARQGANRLYAINAVDGSPTINRDQPAEPPDSVEDRWGDLSQSGIAPEVVILFPGPDTPCAGPNCPPPPPPVCKVGVEDCGLGFTNLPVRTFWSEQSID